MNDEKPPDEPGDPEFKFSFDGFDPAQDQPAGGQAEETLAPNLEESRADLSIYESDDAAQVHRVARALTKAVKAVQMYPPANPMCHQFAEKLIGRLDEAMKSLDQVRLVVGRNKLFFQGEMVLMEEGREESLPGRLFWSGIREIAFHQGIQIEEILSFLGLFRRTSQESEKGENDIVTLLWDAEFENITYIAIDDIFDLTSDDDPVPTEFGNEFMNFVDLEMHNLDDDEEITKEANRLADEIRKKINEDDVELFGISQDERESLKAEIAEEESPRMLGDIIGIVGETLFLEPDSEGFSGLVQVLCSAMLGFVNEGKLRESVQVYRMLEEVRNGREDLTPGMISTLDGGMASLYDGARLDELARHLDTSEILALESLTEFVEFLPDAAVAGLCDVLGCLENPRARRVLLASLSARAKRDIRAFIPFLKDTRWELICDVAQILGGTADERAVGPLKELLRHREFRVRRNALGALGRLGTGRALDVLTGALQDEDPRIRMAAARCLGMAGRQALPALLGVIESQNFDERPLTEKRSFYEALAYAGGTGVFDLVKVALGKKSLFRKQRAEELRACACEALGWIGGPEATQLLKGHLGDRSALVRTAAQSGLRRIEGGEGREPLIKEAA